MSVPLLEVTDLKMHFPVREGILLRSHRSNKAVDGVSLSIMPGQTMGLVGESGCGKSTLGRCISRLYQPTEGSIVFEGQDITHLKGSSLLPYRQHIQMIFQDPMESLNARHTVGEILEEPFIIHKLGDSTFRAKRVKELLEIVIDGLTEEAVADAMRRGMHAAARRGIRRIAAGNYGGNLGQFQIHLHQLLDADPA